MIGIGGVGLIFSLLLPHGLSLSYHETNMKLGKTFSRKRLTSVKIRLGPSMTWMTRRRRSSLLFEPKQNNIKSINNYNFDTIELTFEIEIAAF